jgi:CRP/FNR family transcriptional regulator, polysaccharide utilization system transcription regulator
MNKTQEQPHCTDCDVRFKSIFCGLNNIELEDLDIAKHCTSVRKGQVLFNEGAYPHGLYCVNKGKVKLSQLGDSGKEQILHFVKDGDVIGYRSILSGDKFNFTATVLEESSVCFIPKDIFLKMIENNGNLSLQVIRSLSSELKAAERSITELAQKPVRERLAESLLFLKELYGYEPGTTYINLGLTREELSNMVGTATETVIRLLSDFKSEKMISLNGRKIGLIDVDKLVRTANVPY